MRIKDDAVPPRFSSTADRATYLLAEYKIGVLIAGIGVIILVATGRLGIPSLPPIISTGILAVAIGIVPSMIAAKILIVDKFIPDPRVKVLEISLIDDKSICRIGTHKVPQDLWNDRVHKEGQPVIEPDGPADAIVQEFEFDDAINQIRIKGANREIADPVDITITQNRLEEVYDGLLDSKRKLLKFRNTQKLRQQEIEEQTVNALVAAVEKGTVFSPSGDIMDREIWSDADRSTDAVSDHDRMTNGHDRDGDRAEQQPEQVEVEQ